MTHVISSFEHCDFLELAIIKLEEHGIPKEQIIAIPLDQSSSPPKFFDNIHHSDGFSLFDLAAVLGTVFSVLGATYGFTLHWGPVIWGLIGLAFGALLGFTIDYLLTKINVGKKTALLTEVIVIIECENAQTQWIKRLLFEHKAFGVGVIAESKDYVNSSQ
ncbi:hypothetical protein [Bacillus sp. B15-48]|uniref:hypothetical protein n=1 Tax=Bacillus sp. B15-48 TaxID=1548601 RepID=UPI00193ED331|nr:hypothetical protein [Bacillus sp. B15-48]MBM4763190.1 hypothetical protein [Bacillus sp. B15-48]